MKSPDPRPAWLPAGARRRTRATASVVAVGALTLAAAVSTATAAAATSAAPAASVASLSSVVAALPAAATQNPFGDNVIVFDPSMSPSDIEEVVNGIHAEQVDDEMGTNRWSLLFKPGTYGTDEDPCRSVWATPPRSRAWAPTRATSSSTARSSRTTGASVTAARATAWR